MIRITTGDAMHVYGGLANGVDYTVRLTVRMADMIDGDILLRALEKTQRRYPYLSVMLREDGRSYYYEENPRLIALLHTEARIRLGTAETNYHVWAVCWWEDHIHMDVYHGITDGTGMYCVLATLLYYYCSERYGVSDHVGIRTSEDTVMPEEMTDPQDALVSSDKPRFPAQRMAEAFTLETDGGLPPSEPTIWDIEIPEEAFIRFTSANDASPGTMITLLLSMTIDALYPDRKKDIISAYVINARPMLGAEQTHHNCLSMALFPYSDRIRSMPFSRKCTVYRGMTFVQSEEMRVLESMAKSAEVIRAAMHAADSVEGKNAAFGPIFRGGEGFITFLVSYTGRWGHPALGAYMREFWTHPPNTFSLMIEVSAVGGKVFLSVQQRFEGDEIRNGFLRQLDAHQIPYTLRRKMQSDIAFSPLPLKV